MTKAKMPKRILSIHAHPDDAEILAGGTLALLAERGHSITMVTMTPGDCGSAELSREEIAAVRRKEASASAALIGAGYLCAEFRDLAVMSDDASRRRVVEILRVTRPDIVLTASPADYMCDHEAASRLVRDACFAAPVRNYSTGAESPAPALGGVPHLYYMNPIENLGPDGETILPHFVVDVTSTIGMKTLMLASHASQREWLLKHHGMDDYILTMQRWTEASGLRVGVKYGEGFRIYRGHAYPQTPLLEELLEGLVLR
ncbi:MAG: PIG-L family deacetylase [Acidobacteria bacterium]|nr:PIG-L family deacetylase [Acidobacteriota bacterium]